VRLFEVPEPFSDAVALRGWVLPVKIDYGVAPRIGRTPCRGYRVTVGVMPRSE